jgi:hypothetical protein
LQLGTAEAWSSQNPASLAAFYAENGSLAVNGDTPSVGCAAITAIARAYMTAVPDMLVKMDKGSHDGEPRGLSLDADWNEHGP